MKIGSLEIRASSTEVEYPTLSEVNHLGYKAWRESVMGSIPSMQYFSKKALLSL